MKNPTVMGWATRLSSVLVGSGVSYNICTWCVTKNLKKKKQTMRRSARGDTIEILIGFLKKILPITIKTLVIQAQLAVTPADKVFTACTTWQAMCGNGRIAGMKTIRIGAPCAAARGTTLMIICAALPGSAAVRSAGATFSVFVLFAPVLFPEDLNLWFLNL